MLAGEKRGKERGKSIHPSTPTEGLLNGISYAGWWRVREEKGGQCPLVESEINSKIFKVSLLFLRSLDCRSSRPGLP
jgi:hypothetical protein